MSPTGTCSSGQEPARYTHKLHTGNDLVTIDCVLKAEMEKSFCGRNPCQVLDGDGLACTQALHAP